MSRQRILVKIEAIIVCLIMLSSSTILAQDLCDEYYDRYRVCAEKRDAGSNVELTDPPVSGMSVCFDYTDETTCVDNDCIWDANKSRCYGEVCQNDSNVDGKVTGTDLNVLKKEYGRQDCPTTPDVPAPAPVPKTGQTTCYDTDGNPRDCAGTGEDGEYQKGVTWPNPRFTDNEDGTVTDNLTGLIWLKDANCIATNYPGFDIDGTAGDGGVTWQHALDFVAGINDGTYPDCGAGNTDWRLPNRNELNSLIHIGFYNPALPDTAGTGQWSEGDPFTNVQSSNYWSSTTYANYPPDAWDVHMRNGIVYHYNKSNNFYVWPVRGGQ